MRLLWFSDWFLPLGSSPARRDSVRTTRFDPARLGLARLAGASNTNLLEITHSLAGSNRMPGQAANSNLTSSQSLYDSNYDECFDLISRSFPHSFSPFLHLQLETAAGNAA